VSLGSKYSRIFPANYLQEIFILAKFGVIKLAARLGLDGMKKADQRDRRGQK